MNEYVQVVFMLHCRNPAKALQSKDFLSFAGLLMSFSGVRFGWPPTNKISSPGPQVQKLFLSVWALYHHLRRVPKDFDWMIIKIMVGDLPTSLQRTSTWNLLFHCFFVRQNAKVVVTNRRYWKFSWDILCAYYVCMCEKPCERVRSSIGAMKRTPCFSQDQPNHETLLLCTSRIHTYIYIYIYRYNNYVCK